MNDEKGVSLIRALERAGRELQNAFQAYLLSPTKQGQLRWLTAEAMFARLEDEYLRYLRRELSRRKGRE